MKGAAVFVALALATLAVAALATSASHGSVATQLKQWLAAHLPHLSPASSTASSSTTSTSVATTASRTHATTPTHTVRATTTRVSRSGPSGTIHAEVWPSTHVVEGTHLEVRVWGCASSGNQLHEIEVLEGRAVVAETAAVPRFCVDRNHPIVLSLDPRVVRVVGVRAFYGLLCGTHRIRVCFGSLCTPTITIVIDCADTLRNVSAFRLGDQTCVQFDRLHHDIVVHVVAQHERDYWRYYNAVLHLHAGQNAFCISFPARRIWVIHGPRDSRVFNLG